MAHMTNSFTAWDYAVFIGMLLVSMGIGIFFACRGDGQRTQGEYLHGGRKMSVIPVGISILVSFQSAILILGTPAEMYAQGTEYFVTIIGTAIGFLIGGLVFVPLIYPLRTTSAYEYMELRFKSRAVRLLATFIMIIGQVIYMGIASFAPSTALEAVTGFPVWATLLIVGVVGTFYTTIGGMKAVVWTDVFQAGVMFAGVLSIVIQGSNRVHGFSRVWEINDDWDRIHFFNWSGDFRVRHTVWGMVIGTIFNTLGVACLSQPTVQRFSSLRTLREAQWSLYISIFGQTILLLMTCMSGMIMFAFYADRNCDLLRRGLVDNPNQLVPYFVMEILSYPCVPGLFMASCFSGALSSISSSMNSLAAITWEDFLKPRLGPRMTDYQQTVLIKILVAVYGCISLGISFAVTYLDGTVIQVGISLISPSGGTIAGMFLLGALFPFANKYGVFAGGTVGIAITMWRAIGAYATGVQFKRVPFPNGTCGLNISTSAPAAMTSAVANMTINTAAAAADDSDPLDDFYGISYIWLGAMACAITFVTGLIVSLIALPLLKDDEKKVPTKYQIPVFTRLCCCLPNSWLYTLDCHRDFEKPEDIAQHTKDEQAMVVVPDQLPISNFDDISQEKRPSNKYYVNSGYKGNGSLDGVDS